MALNCPVHLPSRYFLLGNNRETSNMGIETIMLEKLANWVWGVEDFYYHDLDGYSNVHEHVEDCLTYFGVPNEWKAVVRVMADGWSYYGESVWYAKHVDPSTREAWMEEFWKAA
jgi:hypothetical protein